MRTKLKNFVIKERKVKGFKLKKASNKHSEHGTIRSWNEIKMDEKSEND